MKGLRLNGGLDLQRNKEYREEKRWGLKPTLSRPPLGLDCLDPMVDLS